MTSTNGTRLVTLLRRLHLVARQQMHAELHEAGFTDITPAHIYVFQSPGPDGARPTELAARTNMTKQTMNHLLASLEEHGYLEREPDPHDGRGKVIHLTERGRELIRVGEGVVASLERDWADLLGTQRLDDLKTALADLDAAVDAAVLDE